LFIIIAFYLPTRPLYSSPHDPAFKALARGRVRQVVALYETFGLHMSPPAKDLLYQMLHNEPTKRITLEQVLQHPFLNPPPSHEGTATTTTTTTTATTPLEEDCQLSSSSSLNNFTTTTTTTTSELPSSGIFKEHHPPLAIQ